MSVDITDLMQSSPCVSILVEEDGRIAEVNHSSETVTGGAMDEVRGLPIWDVFVPADGREQWSRIAQQVLLDGSTLSRADDWVIRDGSRRSIRWGAAIDRSSESGNPRILISIVATTAADDTEEALGRLREHERTILDHLSASLSIRDEKGRFVFVNRRFRELFALGNRLAEGKAPSGIFPAQLAARFTTLWDLVKETGSPQLVEEELIIGNKQIYLTTSVFPLTVEGGAVHGICVISDDQTQLNAIERNLTLRNQDVAELSEKLISSQEDERRRIARDLHDGVNQDVASLSVELGMLAGASEGTKSDIQSALTELAHRAMDISEQVRRLSHAIHPAALETMGLADALRSFALETAKRGGVKLEFRIDDIPKRPQHEATCIYRVAQEAVQNALKHAGASEIRLLVQADSDRLVLTVTDDGIGFDTSKAASGIGLIGMRERARIAGGQLDLWSEPGAGTRVTLNVKLAQQCP